MKRQKYRPGAFVKIDLPNNRLAFGRLLPGIASRMSVYDFIAFEMDTLSFIDLIAEKNVLFSVGIYRDIITKGTFEIIGYKELSKDEIARIPPTFTQDLANITNCKLSRIGGEDLLAIPEECVGLERASVWEAAAVIQRIEDHYNNKKNFYVELNKVILSRDDPRYMAGPNLKWSFEEEKFYNTRASE